MTRARRALTACAGLALAACLGPQPILYPNATFEQNDESQIDRDLEECAALAEEHKANRNRTGEVASSTVEDAAIGGAAGAVGGAVAGDPGTGAAAGAAAGATAGLIRGLFRIHRDPDPVYRVFVERCLVERGYEVIGWE